MSDDRNERVLAIGEQSARFAKEALGKELIDIASINLKKQHKGYGSLVASMQLQRVPPSKLKNVIGKWWGAIIPGGSLHIIVPSFEWAAEQCYQPEPSPALSVHVLGDEGMENKSIWTMRALRGICFAMQIPVVEARMVDYIIADQYTSKAHYILARKQEKE